MNATMRAEERAFQRALKSKDAAVSKQAAVAWSLSLKWCLRGAGVYAWAQRFGVDLWANAAAMHASDAWVWERMMEDKP